MNELKPLYKITNYEFSKKYSLIENLEYLARRNFREAKHHRKLKDISSDVTERIYHGVTATHQLRLSRLLKTIAKDLRRSNLEYKNE